MDIFENLTAEQREALGRIVSDWIGEGFTTEPYGDAYYDIFEALEITGHSDYDVAERCA